jgi:large subunit ribosomal protein L6
MSRIGRKPVEIPENVTVDIDGRKVVVKGPKGELSIEVRPEIAVKKEDNTIVTEIKIKTKQSNAFWGLTSSLIKNMVEGVVNGYEKKLELVGVGYRVAQNGPDKITLSVGYSHPVEFTSPDGVILQIEDNNKITISGIDKQLVGLTAAQIRKVRRPEPYKGKGIKYVDEIIKRKAGKSAKV